MNGNKYSVDIEDFSIIEEENYSDTDEQFAVVEIYVCHDGNNRHGIPIKKEALINAKETLKNKFLVAGFDGNDFEGHEPDEKIIGFFPESSKMKLVKKRSKTYLVAQAIMSKIYAKWAYDVFRDRGNQRDVSMEITVTKGEVDEYDNLLTIDEFVFNGVTVLGTSHVPACEGSSASIIKFDCENALKAYNEHRKETAMEFSGKEDMESMNKNEEKEKSVEETKDVKAAQEEDTQEQKEKEQPKEDDKTMYSEGENSKKEETPKEEKPQDNGSEEDVNAECKNSKSEVVEKECNNECGEKCETTEKCEDDNDVDDKDDDIDDDDDRLPAEKCEDKKEEPAKEDIKAEVDALKKECEALKAKVDKYEAKEKSMQVESIIANVLDVFSKEEISELRQNAEKYSLDELNIFDNEVKARAFEKVKDQKFEIKNFTKVAINNVLDDKTKVSKYTW